MVKEANKVCSNKYDCPCTYDCVNHAKCCDCVMHHRECGGIVACLKNNK